MSNILECLKLFITSVEFIIYPRKTLARIRASSCKRILGHSLILFISILYSLRCKYEIVDSSANWIVMSGVMFINLSIISVYVVKYLIGFRSGHSESSDIRVAIAGSLIPLGISSVLLIIFENSSFVDMAEMIFYISILWSISLATISIRHISVHGSWFRSLISSLVVVPGMFLVSLYITGYIAGRGHMYMHGKSRHSHYKLEVVESSEEEKQ